MHEQSHVSGSLAMTRKRHNGLDMSGRDRSPIGRETVIRPHFSEDRNLV